MGGIGSLEGSKGWRGEAEEDDEIDMTTNDMFICIRVTICQLPVITTVVQRHTVATADIERHQ